MSAILSGNRTIAEKAMTRNGKFVLSLALTWLVLIFSCGLSFYVTEVMAQTEATKRVIKGADMAYYFADDGKFVAAESLDGRARTIMESEDLASEDGMNLMMKSTCQARGDVPIFSGATELVGRATTVVYASSGPSHLIILGVEDLTKVRSRKFVPLKPIKPEDGGICCCALKKGADAIWFCPCGTNC